MYKTDRAKFYELVVKGNSIKKDPNVMFDPIKKSNAHHPSDVKRIAHSEASKILANKHRQSTNIPSCLSKLYKQNAIKADDSVWYPLVMQFSTNDIIEYVSGPSKPQGLII